ncbi:chaperonin 10-like protein [Amylocystis lapponica]|nr:chaperonin 10-like protein [Amylocystis lapponica]
MSAQQKALLLQSKMGAFAVGSVDVPVAGPGQLLVKIQAAALNPIEWKIQSWGLFVEKFPSVPGTDNAGIVEQVGEGVTGFAKGDRVLYQGIYTQSETGGYQHYAIAQAETTAKIPSHISFDQAASVPVGVATVALGLFDQNDLTTSVGLYPPWKEGGRGKYQGKPIVIFGGAGSVGQYAIQLAKLSGFSPIIATASPHNSAFLTGLGATHVLDRGLSADALRAEVARLSPKPVETIFDAVSDDSTQNVAYDILAPGGRGSFVLPPQIAAEKLSSDKTIVMVQGNANFTDTGASLYSRLTVLLEEGVVQPNRVEVLPNGLHGIVEGLERLKNNLVSGKKLVAHPQETV